VKSTEFPQKVKRGSVIVKIYRTPSHGCDSYTLSYYQDGVRKRPTFPTLKRAREEAESIAGRLASTDSYTIKMSSADCASYSRARQLLDPLGIAIETAAAEVADTRKRLGDTPLSYVIDDFLKRHSTKIPPRAISVVTAEFIEAKRVDRVSERYLQCLRYCMGKFSAAFPGNIGSVTSAEIDDWLRKSGLSPRSRNNLRNSVQTLFGFAKARGYLRKDHAEIEAVPVVKDRDGEIEVFTPAELVEILNHGGDKLIPFLALGAFAGIRHAEIQRLHWTDLRFEDGIIEIQAGKAKTASRRTIPILDNLREWLLPYRQDSGLVCGYRNVAFEMDERVRRINRARRAAWAAANGIKAEALKQTEREAGELLAQAKADKSFRRGDVPPGAETAKLEGWAAFRWKHNALRHSFISYRVADIQNVNQVALEAGNSPQMIFRHYRELVRAADAKAWFAIRPELRKERAVA